MLVSCCSHFPLQEPFCFFVISHAGSVINNLSFAISKNIILCDCLEERTIHSKDYVVNSDTSVERLATRRLQQAMVPGEHLVKVEVIQRPPKPASIISK
jgi:hypothetical protein